MMNTTVKNYGALGPRDLVIWGLAAVAMLLARLA